jgi:hypothetical protein
MGVDLEVAERSDCHGIYVIVSLSRSNSHRSPLFFLIPPLVRPYSCRIHAVTDRHVARKVAR